MNDSPMIWNPSTGIGSFLIIILVIVGVLYFMGFFDGLINLFIKSKEITKILKHEHKEVFKIHHVEDEKLKKKIEQEYHEYIRAKAYYLMMKKNMDTLLHETRAKGYDFLPNKKEFEH